MPNYSTGINLPPNVSLSLASYAGMYGVDPNIAQAVAQVESGGNQFRRDGSVVTSSVGAKGIMQLMPATFYGLKRADGTAFTDINDPQQNMEAGVAYLAQQYQHFGDYPTALAAYNAGPGNVKKYGGIPPFNETQKYVRNISKLAEKAGSTTQDVAPQNLQRQLQSANTPLSPAAPVHGIPVTPDFISTLDPQLQIDNGLDEVPWYDDDGLITGNPRIRKSVQPISFKVYLDQYRPSLILKNPRSNAPIEVQLNCSMRELTIESKHVFTRNPSRTGMHVTFWGMNADLITGQGSTGVFMNQMGITDWFSLANVPDEIKQTINQGFRFGNGTPLTGNAAFNLALFKNAKNNPAEAFRVAAQDAFVEFMKLFQMNGVVWFTSPNYQGFQTGFEQQGANAWSKKAGATSFQQTARNNDVLSRGYVAMKYKNHVYLGYFKSLSWTQDAEKPFSWDFNFVFQVERTISALFYPA